MEDPDMDKPMQAVKKAVRPDWIDSENKIFINKLNFICDNFDKNHEEVSLFFYLKLLG